MDAGKLVSETLGWGTNCFSSELNPYTGYPQGVVAEVVLSIVSRSVFHAVLMGCILGNYKCMLSLSPFVNFIRELFIAS